MTINQLLKLDSNERKNFIKKCIVSSMPPQDVEVLAVLVLGRPGNFQKLTSSDVLVPVPDLILEVLVLRRWGRGRSCAADPWYRAHCMLNVVLYLFKFCFFGAFNQSST